MSAPAGRPGPSTCRPAADRHHPARGQRRHRQDLDHRRAGDPVRRRGRRQPRRDAGGHLRPGRQPGAARAGPRAAGRRASGRSPTRTAARPATTVARAAGSTATPRRAGAAAPASRDALADFDAATIATTHQFCQQVLSGLGVAGDTDAGATLVEDLDDLVVEVVDDLYLRSVRAAQGEPAVQPRGTRCELARARGRRPAGPARAAWTPTPGTRPARRRRFAARGPRRGRPAQAPAAACSATTTCSPSSPTRCGRPTAPAPAADAAALAGGAGRRVPGHRPGAVGDPATGRSTGTPRWC